MHDRFAPPGRRRVPGRRTQCCNRVGGAGRDSEASGRASGRRTSSDAFRFSSTTCSATATRDGTWSAIISGATSSGLYASGYRPVTVSEVVDKKIDLPAGLSPVVFTFDDAGPSQFSYIDHNGTLEIDPNSAVGIWLAFHKEHPDWRNKATFCMLSGGAAGHAFFGEKGIEGQKSEWRFRKVKYPRRAGLRAVWTHALAREPREVQRRGGAGADRARHAGHRFGGAGLSRAHVRAAARRVAEESGAGGVRASGRIRTAGKIVAATTSTRCSR